MSKPTHAMPVIRRLRLQNTRRDLAMYAPALGVRSSRGSESCEGWLTAEESVFHAARAGAMNSREEPPHHRSCQLGETREANENAELEPRRPVHLVAVHRIPDHLGDVVGGGLHTEEILRLGAV